MLSGGARSCQILWYHSVGTGDPSCGAPWRTASAGATSEVFLREQQAAFHTSGRLPQDLASCYKKCFAGLSCKSCASCFGDDDVVAICLYQWHWCCDLHWRSHILACWWSRARAGAWAPTRLQQEFAIWGFFPFHCRPAKCKMACLLAADGSPGACIWLQFIARFASSLGGNWFSYWWC